jgi:hypothetical protein
MAATAAPYGLRPINLIGGQPYAGSTRMFKIASGYAANIFYGQAVKLNGTTGTIEADTSTTALPASGVLGVFVGCTYTDPGLRYKVFRQSWPTGTVASDAEAYVIDDPDVVMQAQAGAAITQAQLGENIGFGTSAGSTTTGNATTPLATTSAATATLPLRIVGFVEGPDSAIGDAFTDILVKWNMPSTNGTAMIGGHSYMSPLGL